MRIVIFAILAVSGTVLLAAAPAFAWGPSAHLYIGKQALDQASSLGPYLSALLSSNPLDFLYGSIFADMSLGKKFLHYAKFAHNWRVGFSMRDTAETDAEAACAWGYLAHLAADTVSHNEYIPRKLVEHYKLLGRGHIFFEGRFDSMLPDKNIHELSRDVIDAGTEHNDEFLEKSITHSLLSFNTNRRLYRSLLTIHRNKNLQQYRRYRTLHKNHLSHAEVREYLQRSQDAVMDLLENARAAACYAQDPHGKLALKQAASIRFKLRRSINARKLLKEALETVTIGPHRS